MISKEILKKVRRIEIQTRKWVNNIFSGEYESVFKGQGMEFSEVREYLPGDDIRSIDWNVTARMGVPYVKKFIEERELTVLLVVDMSSSGNFGSRVQLKRDMAVEISALLAFSAIKNNDRVGLISFTDRVEQFIPPKKGKSHVLRLIRELLAFKPVHRKTDLAGVLEHVNHVVKRKAIIFVLSDFLAENYEKPLGIASQKHDLIAVTLTDPMERRLSGKARILFEDAETGERISIRPSNPEFQKNFRSKTDQTLKERIRLFRSLDMDHIDLQTNQDHFKPLISFFQSRARRI